MSRRLRAFPGTRGLGCLDLGCGREPSPPCLGEEVSWGGGRVHRRDDQGRGTGCSGTVGQAPTRPREVRAQDDRSPTGGDGREPEVGSSGLLLRRGGAGRGGREQLGQP